MVSITKREVENLSRLPKDICGAHSMYVIDYINVKGSVPAKMRSI